MDQLKPIIAAIKKHYFWILTAVVLLAAVGVYYKSHSELQTDIEQQVSKINGNYSTVSSVRALVSTHPNAASEAGMNEIIAVHKDNVRQAWQLQYDRQEKILQWPKGVTDPQAIAILDTKRPIETTTENPMTTDPIVGTYRAQYRDYINRVFPGIAAIIGTQWTAPPLPGAAVTASNNASASSLVTWSSSSQEKLRSAIVPWYDQSTPPSTLDILYTQEDLWILEGMMNIIAAVNGDARENFQAPIKEILWLRIGKNANGNAGEISQVTAAASGAVGSDPYGGIDPYASSGTPSGPAAGGGGGAGFGDAPTGRDPANMRYVDSNYQPISSTDLVSKMKSSSPEDAFFAVAKRIPIQMRLKMDQRKIPQLIAQCGNNDLIVEVKQVRIATKESSERTVAAATVGGGGGGAYSGGDYAAQYAARSGEGMGGNQPDYGGYDGGYGGGGAAGNVKWAEEKPYELEVEIYGIVLLYNPVDIEKLGIEKVSEDTALETTVDESAAAPAPAAAPQPAVAPGVPAEQPPTSPAVPGPPAGATTPPADTAVPPVEETTPPADAGSPPAGPGVPPSESAAAPAAPPSTPS